MATRHNRPWRIARQRCAHGSCFDFAKEPSLYCEFHAAEHKPKDEVVRESAIAAIPRELLMAGSARVRRHIDRLDGAEETTV